MHQLRDAQAKQLLKKLDTASKEKADHTFLITNQYSLQLRLATKTQHSLNNFARRAWRLGKTMKSIAEDVCTISLRKGLKSQASSQWQQTAIHASIHAGIKKHDDETDFHAIFRSDCCIDNVLHSRQNDINNQVRGPGRRHHRDQQWRSHS